MVELSDADEGCKIQRAVMDKTDARQAHNLKVVGSNPTPATKYH